MKIVGLKNGVKSILRLNMRADWNETVSMEISSTTCEKTPMSSEHRSHKNRNSRGLKRNNMEFFNGAKRSC
jgi:hypothetical protein